MTSKLLGGFFLFFAIIAVIITPVWAQPVDQETLLYSQDFKLAVLGGLVLLAVLLGGILVISMRRR